MLGLPQMKLAWIVLSGPEPECRAASERLETIADAFLSANTPSQRALPLWLQTKDVFVAEVLERVKGNFEILCETIGDGGATHGSPLHEPEGGWYAVLPLPEGIDDERITLRLLENQDVLVHPGYFFDFKEEVLVLSLLPEPERFREGARRIREGIGSLC